MGRPRKHKQRAEDNPYNAQARHLRDVALVLDKVVFSFKELDAQNKTIIILLNGVEAQLKRLGDGIEDKIGQRIETLRQELRKALVALIVREDNTGDVQKIIRDHMFTRPERKQT